MLRLDPTSWPIRWRLTALNVGVLATTLVALSAVFLLLLDKALVGITADHLRDQAEPALQASEDMRAPSFVEPRRAVPAASSMPRTAALLVRRLSGPDTGVLVFDNAGALVLASEQDEDVEAWPEPSAEQLSAALSGTEGSVVLEQETRRTLMLALPIRGPDGDIVGVLGLARSLQLIDQFEARLKALLVIGMVLAVLVACGLGLRATRAALRPLDLVVRAAREIGAGHLDKRLRMRRRDEIGELAEAFDGMLDRLATALAAQRRFVADAAHELRTPLTALGGMVEMLQLGADRGDKPTMRHMVDTMDREIDRLGRLVSDLLSLSRLDGEQPLALTPVPLAAVVTDVASQTRMLAHGQHVQLRITASPTVLGDADRLKQVLINLAANALAFTPPDGRIEFGLDRADGHARLIVTDTGTGIAPEVLPRVMDRFVRGDRSRARSTGGTGLGLPIARGIVEAHGGTIALESEPGRGTRVIVELPLGALSSGNLQFSKASASGSRVTIL